MSLEFAALMKLLIQCGANPEIADNRGLTPLDLAKDAETRAFLKDAIKRFKGERKTLLLLWLCVTYYFVYTDNQWSFMQQV